MSFPSFSSLPAVSGPDQPLYQQFLGPDPNITSSRPGNNIITASAHDNSRQIVGPVTTNISGVQNIEIHINSPADERHVRDCLRILEWLAPTNQRQAYDTALKRHEPGTGLWFLDGTDYANWLTQPASLLWIHGGVGCGKTVLCSAIIKKTFGVCSTDKSSRICCFYSSFQDTSRQDLSAILRAFIAQCSTVDSIPSPLQKLFSECHKVYPPNIPTNDDLSSTLITILNEQTAKADDEPPTASRTEPKKTFLFIDALDEIPLEQRWEVFEFLNQLANQKLPHVRILVTSRDEPSIREGLSGSIQWSEVPVDRRAVEIDIENYVRRTLSSHRSLRPRSDDTKNAILSRVVKEDSGMFRWAALQIDMLTRHTGLNAHRVTTLLAELPKDLNDTYARMLLQIETEGLLPQAFNALRWLVCSKQPMWIEDLVEACVIGLDSMPVLDISERQTPYNIYEMLHGLVLIEPPIVEDKEISNRYHIVTLAHFSVQEFLIGNGIAQGPASSFGFKVSDAHEFLARSCLSYLYCYNSFSSRKDFFPLREYAWYNWEKHVPSSVQLTSEPIRDQFRRRADQLYQALKTSRDDAAEEERGGLSFIALGGMPPIIHTDHTSQRRNGIFKVLDWMPGGGKERLQDALNIPYFHPDFEIFGITAETTSNNAVVSRNRPPYIHRPLHHPDSEIRLITLLPSLDQSTPIICQVIHAPLDHGQSYDALSYAWEYNDDRENMYIGESTIEIRGNLASILRRVRLRSESKLPVLWVDVPCLHQADYSETTQQLAILGTIFQQSQQALIGLGKESRNSELAINFLSELASHHFIPGQTFGEFDQFIIETAQAGGWPFVTELFAQQWWTRRWIIQEVVLSSNPTLLYGNLPLSFDTICQVMRLQDIIQQILETQNGLTAEKALKIFQEDLNWQTAKHMAKTRDEFSSDGKLSLFKMLYRFRASRTSHPRDCIYSLLSFSKYAGQELPQYTENPAPEHVFLIASRNILTEYNNLDLLSFCSASKGELEMANPEDIEFIQSLPSWVPDFRYLSSVIPLSLGVFGDEVDEAIFSAGGDRHTPPNMRPEQHDDSILTLGGIFLDRISQVFQVYVREPTRMLRIRAPELVFDDFAFQYGSLSTVQSLTTQVPLGQSKIEACWRALTADQWNPGQRLGQGGKEIHGWYGEATTFPPTSEAEETILLTSPASRLHALSLPRPKLRLHLNFLRGRQLIITDKGFVGLAPSTCVPGDIIALMPGGAVPYVLREIENYEGYFEFIGECYVHGVMDGEVPAALSGESGEYHMEEFKLY